MKRRFAEEHIMGVLTEHQAGMSPAELCREYGISDATFYIWRKKYAGMDEQFTCTMKNHTPCFYSLLTGPHRMVGR